MYKQTYDINLAQRVRIFSLVKDTHLGAENVRNRFSLDVCFIRQGLERLVQTVLMGRDLSIILRKCKYVLCDLVSECDGTKVSSEMLSYE